MDLSLGELLHITGRKPMPEEYLKWIALSVLNAVSYLEKELNTLHRG